MSLWTRRNSQVSKFGNLKHSRQSPSLLATTPMTPKEFIHAVASFLPEYWILTYDEANPSPNVELMEPERRKLVWATDRNADTAYKMAKSLKLCVKESSL